MSLYDHNDDTCRDGVSIRLLDVLACGIPRRRQETAVTHHDRESRKQESLALVIPIEIGVVPGPGTRGGASATRKDARYIASATVNCMRFVNPAKEHFAPTTRSILLNW